MKKEPFRIPGEPEIIFSEDPGDEYLHKVVEPALDARDDIPKAHQEARCVKPPIGCGRKIPQTELEAMNQLTLQEYSMSGWCPTCQDSVFGSDS
jgi:hypothetical protein